MPQIQEILDAQLAWQAVSPPDETAIHKLAFESLVKCAHAIAVLSANLRGIGYTWAASEPVPAEVIERNVRKIEAQTARTIPPILVMFWKTVGGVSFVDLDRYRHVEFWKDHRVIGPSFFCDGLVVDSCNDEWTSFICNDFLDWKENFTPEEQQDFLFSLSPDGYHKDNISGGAPYGVLGGSTWKPVWQNFAWSGAAPPLTAGAEPADFLSYLRTAILECAGFPAFLGLPAFESLKERLLQGVPVF